MHCRTPHVPPHILRATGIRCSAAAGRWIQPRWRTRVTSLRRWNKLVCGACPGLQPNRFRRQCGGGATWTGLQPCKRGVGCMQRSPRLLGACSAFSFGTLVNQAVPCTRTWLQPSRTKSALHTSTCNALAPCIHDGLAQGIRISSRVLQLAPFTCKLELAVAPNAASEAQVPPPRTAAWAMDVRNPPPSASKLEPLQHALPPWFCRPSASWCA